MKGPVALSPHDPRWAGLFASERDRLMAALAPYVLAVEHIGSTAVPGIAAKATIDMDVAIFRLEDAPRCVERMKALGYEYLPELEAAMPERRYFRRVAHPAGSREDLYHVHMVEVGSAFWERDQIFRDFLRAHADAAREYEALKRRLAHEHADNREAYTEGKAEFVRRVEAAASAERAKRAAPTTPAAAGEGPHPAQSGAAPPPS
jgi:GrpB-like predicted nucleotidyltransferase (UPF0157 family)